MVGVYAVLDGASGQALLISAGVILFGVFAIVINILHIDGRPRGVVGGILFILGVIGYWVVRINHWEGAAGGVATGIVLVIIFGFWAGPNS